MRADEGVKNRMSLSLVVIANQLGPVTATTVDISSGMVLSHNFGMTMDSSHEDLPGIESLMFVSFLVIANQPARTTQKKQRKTQRLKMAENGFSSALKSN